MLLVEIGFQGVQQFRGKRFHVDVLIAEFYAQNQVNGRLLAAA